MWRKKQSLKKQGKHGIPIYMDQPYIRFYIENAHPIDLKAFTTSLEAFEDEYRRYMGQAYSGLEESRLFVHKIEAGSIDIVLAAAKDMLPVAAMVNEYLGFVGHIKSYMDYFLGRGEKPEDINIKSCENLKDLQEIIANNPGSRYSIGLENASVHNLTVNFNVLEANGAQNQSLKEIQALKTPTGNIHKEVLFSWSQVKKGAGAAKGQTGDRGIVETLHESPLQVFFSEDSGASKSEMSAGKDNPLHQAYIVDVELMVLRGKPKAYKILRFHKALA